MGNSFFHFKQFSIHQQEKGLKVTTDACLLGATAEHSHPLRCLDIGSGNGVISLFLAQRFQEAHIDAVEIDPDVNRNAGINFRSSPFSDRISQINADILQLEFNCDYQLIVCNPPYFSNHLQKKDSAKNRAIHNLSLPFPELIAKTKKLLSDDGKFWLILPPYEAEQLIQVAEASELYCHREIKVYNRPEKHFRTILCLTHDRYSIPEKETLLLEKNQGLKTDEFHLLMSEFYLENTEKYKSRSY